MNAVLQVALPALAVFLIIGLYRLLTDRCRVCKLTRIGHSRFNRGRYVCLYSSPRR
jgi:hypothetical protein